MSDSLTTLLMNNPMLAFAMNPALSGLASTAPMAAQNYTNAAAAMNPALIGTSAAASLDPSSATQAASSISPSWASSLGGSGGSSGLGGLQNALKALGSGKGSDNVSPPSAVMGSMPPSASSTYHPGSPYSGLSNSLQNLTTWRQVKGLLGI